MSVEIITQSLEAQRQQLLAEFEAERTNHQRVLRDYDRLEQRYQNLQDELEIEKLSPAPRRVSGEAHMGFDGLISASSSGSSQNILLQDLYIVFQCFVCVHCSWNLPAYSSPKPMLSGTLRSDDGDVCANVKKKKIGFKYQNKNFALAAHFFVHYFTLTARLRHENALFAKTKRDFFSLSELGFGS